VAVVPAAEAVAEAEPEPTVAEAPEPVLNPAPATLPTEQIETSSAKSGTGLLATGGVAVAASAAAFYLGSTAAKDAREATRPQAYENASSKARYAEAGGFALGATGAVLIGAGITFKLGDKDEEVAP
jgi:hypothetical protein